MKLDFLNKSLKKCSNIKLHEKNRWELFRLDRRTDMTKPIVPLRHFANVPKIGESEGYIGTENSKERI